jgi:hypothetical protein
MVILENAELCIPPRTPSTHRARYLLTRSIIKRHLAVHLPHSHPNFAVNVFPSLKSPEFQEYLRLTPIHFVMTHDGSQRSITCAPEANPLDAEIQSVDDENHRTKILLRGMIWSFNIHKLNVALINRIEFRDSKVFTMIVESFTPPIKLKLMMITKFVHEIADTRKLLEESREATAPDIELSFGDKDLEEVSEAFSEEDLNESYCLVTYGVSKLLKQQGCDDFLASAFVLHSIVMKHTPLAHRRLPLVTFDVDFEEQIDLFLAGVSKILRNAVDNEKWNELMISEEFECDSVDLVDGRLFRVVVQAICDNSLHGVIPRAAQPDWALLSGLVVLLSDKELNISGIIEPAFSKSTAEEADFDEKTEDLAVLPFTNSVFDKHLACIDVKTDSSLSAQFGAMKIYRETSHWHNHKKPLNPKLLPAQKVSKWRYVNQVFRSLKVHLTMRS